MPVVMMQGQFITFEGGEGAGKTTLIKGLALRLGEVGHEVVLTREPGGTQGAESIRDLLVNGDAERWTALSELCLFYAARHDHLERLIRPALARGAIVLCDRFADSTRAYQGQAGGAGPEAVETLDRLIVGASQPDLTLIIDVPPETGLARAAARRGTEDRFESKTLAFHQALRAGYLRLAQEFASRCVVIDGTQTPEAVQETAWASIQNRLGPHLGTKSDE
jgi:dTMP kinase